MTRKAPSRLKSDGCPAIASHVFVFEGLLGHPTDPVQLSYPFVRSHWVGLLEQSLGADAVHYHSESDRGVRRALAEALAAADGNGAAGGCEFVVLGFSNGGHAAVQFAVRLAERGLALRLGFTADPIPKRFDFLRPARNSLVRPDNVGRWVNFYERTDRHSLLGLAPLKGHPMRNADVNRRVDVLGDKAHLRLPSFPPLLSALSCELQSVGGVGAASAGLAGVAPMPRIRARRRRGSRLCCLPKWRIAHEDLCLPRVAGDRRMYSGPLPR